MSWRKISLYFNTIRYIRLSQILNRLYHIVKKKLGLNKLIFLKQVDIESIQPIVKTYTSQTFYKKSDSFEFTFINKTIDTKGDWFPPAASQLWIYNLHYFAYLSGVEPSEYQQLVNTWIDQVPAGTHDAWHLYTVSLRICNWIWSYSQIRDKLSPQFRDKMLQSLHMQVAYLMTNLEFDVLGNHLIENCKALIIGGVFFRDSKLIEQGISILREQLSEQILPDGAHYELSPSYHYIVLEDMVDIYQALTVAAASRDLEWLSVAIAKMTQWLTIMMDKRSLPLFNDSYVFASGKVDALLSYIKDRFSIDIDPGAGNYFLGDSGYFVHKSSDMYLVFDGGRICPDFLCAHAHNDILSYVLSLKGIEVVTDSGIYEYAAGVNRDYFRSAWAHNTVTINDVDQNEMWGSFRVARRRKPYNFVFNAAQVEVSASHSCYQQIGVAEITRKIQIKSAEIYVMDRIVNQRDNNTFQSYIHFASDIRLLSRKDDSSGCQVVLSNGNIQVILNIKSSYDIITGDSAYSPDFYIKQNRLMIRISGNLIKGINQVEYSISHA